MSYHDLTKTIQGLVKKSSKTEFVILNVLRNVSEASLTALTIFYHYIHVKLS